MTYNSSKICIKMLKAFSGGSLESSVLITG